MRSVLLAVSVLCLTSTASAQPAAPMPDWISGYWLSCENGEQTAENWFGAGTGTLLGTNLTRHRHGEYEFEMLSVRASAAGFSYFGQPSGNPPVEFALKETHGQRVVFENLQHDFPQRIIYWRVGNVLHARVEGQMHGQVEGQEWAMRRQPLDTKCHAR